MIREGLRENMEIRQRLLERIRPPKKDPPRADQPTE